MLSRITIPAAILLAILLYAVSPRISTEADLTGLSLESAGGERIPLRVATGGKPALLVFWATWCAHCNGAVPEINRIHSRLSGRLRVLAIDYMEDREKVTAFIKEKNVSYTVLLDRKGDAARRYKIVGIPTYILLDAQGKIAFFDNALPPSIEKFL
jgi:thiol-disulfide isomerase/thioredoxin